VGNEQAGADRVWGQLVRRLSRSGNRVEGERGGLGDIEQGFRLGVRQHREAKPDEARKLASEATSKMKPLPNEEKLHFRNDELIVWMAYKEAKELLGLDSISTAAGPVGK
jgi:hypothetical protein